MASKAKPKNTQPVPLVKYEGYIPGAHPTSPGGMNRADLRVEAAEHHGISMEVSREMTWPALIDAVCEGRLAREREVKARQVAQSIADRHGADVFSGKKAKKHKGKKSKKCKRPEWHDGKCGEVQPGDDPDAEMAPVHVVAKEFKGVSTGRITSDDYAAAKANDLREQALRGMQVPALKAIAKEHKLRGYSTLRRPDLIDAILAHEFEQAVVDAGEMNTNEVAYAAEPVCVYECGKSEDEHAGSVLGHMFLDAALYEEGEAAPPVAHTSDTVEIEVDGAEFDPEALFEEMTAAYEAEKKANPPLFLGIPGIKDYVFDGHAGAGPSASSRWMQCSMSLSASRAFLETLTPNQQAKIAESNLAARQGTTAHGVGEVKANYMLGRITEAEQAKALEHFATHPAEGEEFNEEMDDYVNEYVGLIQTYANEHGAENIGIEKRVSAAIPLTGLHEGEVYVVHGSVDASAKPVKDHPVLVCVDLKYGEGIEIEAIENSQALIYALGELGELVDEEGNLTVDIETVRVHIAQPRLGGIKTWELSLDDLLDWRDNVLGPALTLALYGEDEGATFNPTDSACQFCLVRGSCAALAEQRYADAAEAFTVIQDYEVEHGAGSLPEAGTLTNERLGSLMAQIAPLVALNKDLREEAQRRLYRGAAVPGFDLRNYSPPRKWRVGEGPDALNKKIKKALRKAGMQDAFDDLFQPPEIVTPTAAEKILGEEGYKVIEPLIEKPDKRASISTGPKDRRSKWEGRAPEDMFPDEPGDLSIDAKALFPDD